jgi:glycosyltransferase involved in cell wall biosynthesis
MPWHLREFDWVTVLSARSDFRRFFDLRLARLTGYQRISVIPNGTYPERFTGSGEDFREAFGITENFIFLCVANYSTRKNQELAVRAFRGARLGGAALVFVGSELAEYGLRMQRLDAQLAATQPAGRVLCLERVSQNLTVSAYLASDVFVLSAKAETQPIVLLESMAAGKPWISTDTGCVRELPGGIVVENEKAMVMAMQRLASEPSLRQKLGREGRQASIELYNWKTTMAAYDTLFRRLMTEDV